MRERAPVNIPVPRSQRQLPVVPAAAPLTLSTQDSIDDEAYEPMDASVSLLVREYEISP